MGARTAAGQHCGFERVNGQHVWDNRASLVHPLDAGERYTSFVQVRRAGVRGYLNGALLVEHLTDYSDLTPIPEWKLLPGGVLGLGTRGRPARFHKAQLIILGANPVEPSTRPAPPP
jgi:hypothetical protein